MSWTSTGTLELSTRTGNTKEPDDTWSPWSKGMTAAGMIGSPPARYFQVRARWSRDKDAVLSEVTVPFVTDNLRAVVTKVEVTKKKKTEKGGSVSQSGAPIDGGTNTKISLSWKVDNPDNDKLRHKLQYRLVGTTTWYDMLKPSEKVTAETYTWDTADMPEGEYRVRVTATDELSNPPGRARSHALESGIILVDNTPPRVEGLKVAGRRIQGRAIDGVGPIQRIEVGMVGADEWYPFDSKDGIFDEQSEDFDADVSSFAPKGAVLMAVRVYDSANNFVVRNVALK
jgi:hypothetical protein